MPRHPRLLPLAVLQFFHVGLVVFTFVAAFTKADTRNWTPFFPDILVPSGPRTIITGASHIFFVFIGFDVIALGAEEVRDVVLEWMSSTAVGRLGGWDEQCAVCLSLFASLCRRKRTCQFL